MPNSVSSALEQVTGLKPVRLGVKTRLLESLCIHLHCLVEDRGFEPRTHGVQDQQVPITHSPPWYTVEVSRLAV